MFILFTKLINVFYHEAHEANEEKKQSGLWNKVIDYAIVVITLFITVYEEESLSLQVLHDLHGENA